MVARGEGSMRNKKCFGGDSFGFVEYYKLQKFFEFHKFTEQKKTKNKHKGRELLFEATRNMKTLIRGTLVRCASR